MNSSHLRHHDKSVHDGVTYDCNICQATFTIKSSLSLHINSVHFKESHQINVRYVIIKQHVRVVYPDMSKMFIKRVKILIVVNVTSLSRRDICLKTHVKMFHSEEQTLYNCNVCTFQSVHQWSLKNHVRNVHQKLK